MAFFTKGKPAGAETPPAAPPPGTPGGPISWDKLVPQEPAKQPTITPPAAQPPPTAPAQPQPSTTAGSPLDPQSRDIIDKAGKDLGDMLFKGKKDDGDGKK
jgi:hypothetical protein